MNCYWATVEIKIECVEAPILSVIIGQQKRGASLYFPISRLRAPRAIQFGKLYSESGLLSSKQWHRASDLLLSSLYEGVGDGEEVEVGVHWVQSGEGRAALISVSLSPSRESAR